MVNNSVSVRSEGGGKTLSTTESRKSVGQESRFFLLFVGNDFVMAQKIQILFDVW